MRLFDDARFYAAIALAVLILLVFTMCSTGKLGGGADKHAGDTHGDTTHESAESADDDKDGDTEHTAEQTDDDSETTQTASHAVSDSDTATVQSIAATQPQQEQEQQEQEPTEETETAAAETESSEDTSVTEASTEPDDSVNAESTEQAEVTVEPFELTPLAESGDPLPDLKADIQNLGADIKRYTTRIEGAQELSEGTSE